MSIEAIVSLANQLSVEALLAASGFISGDEENGVSLRVEGEGYAPDSVCRVET